MQFSVFLMGTSTGSYFDIVEQVCDADALGFRGVWLAERSFANGDLLWPSPMIAAGYLAAVTRRIRIGLAARLLPFHHPLEVAADAATLDVLSDGRFDLGLSRSSMDDTPYRMFGVSREESSARGDEAVDVVRLALGQEHFSYEGRHFALDGVTLLPRPVQRPSVPLYLIANGPAAIDAAADKGLSIFVHGAHRLDGVQEVIARFRARSRAAGIDPDDIDVPVNRFVFVGKTNAHAHKVMQRAFTEFLDRRAPDLKALLVRKFGEAARRYEFLAEEIGVFGDAEHCVARLRELRDTAGLRHVLCTFNLITLDHESCVESMNRFAAEVMPCFEREDTPVAARAGVRRHGHAPQQSL